MEFKGTKGRWEARLKGQIASAVYCDNTQICMRARSTTEAKADMLLISKAPEMLKELVNEVEILKAMGLGDTERCKRKERLIKEATEL